MPLPARGSHFHSLGVILRGPGILSLVCLLLPAIAHCAEISQFIGTWCSAPCALGSASRPWDLPCSLRIQEQKISWKHKGRAFARKYEVIERAKGEETLLVRGGGLTWYEQKSIPSAQHKITLTKNHGNERAASMVRLSDSRYVEKEAAWREGGMMFIIRNDGPCPDRPGR